MNKKQLITICLAMMPLALMAQQGLKDAVGKYCLIGAAVNQWQSDGQVPQADAVLAKHFNCVVAENCMKCGEIAAIIREIKDDKDLYNLDI